MDDIDDVEWSESKAVKKLWAELFVRSIFYIAIVIVALIILDGIFAASCSNERVSDCICWLLMIFTCPLYVAGLMNRTGCEVKQLEFGIAVAVIISTIILCGCVALVGWSYYHYIVVNSVGAYVILGSMTRYEYGDDD